MNPSPLCRADFRRGDVALKYVKRGYHVLCSHFLTLLLVPVAATVAVRRPATDAPSLHWVSDVAPVTQVVDPHSACQPKIYNRLG